ncbi:hypothetical protein TNCV_3752451 [Trichonephila clavipes]|nr:hypothetical protein TNCV_3752451 [Trichonephila clavipes]
MDVCKCIEPSRRKDTLNSRRAANPLVRLEVEERVKSSRKWQETLSPVNFRAEPLNYLSGSLSRPLSPLIGECAPGSPHRSHSIGAWELSPGTFDPLYETASCPPSGD